MFKKGAITSKVPKQKLILTITFSTNYDVRKKTKKGYSTLSVSNLFEARPRHELVLTNKW